MRYSFQDRPVSKFGPPIWNCDKSLVARRARSAISDCLVGHVIRWLENNLYSCRHVSKWTVISVGCADESLFNLNPYDGRVKCWHYPVEIHNPWTFNYVSRRNLSIMGWGCMSTHGVGRLAFVEGNMDQFAYIDVLEETTLTLVMIKHHSFSWTTKRPAI